MTKGGQCLLVPEVEVDTYWTSLEDDPYQVILLYHDHGTCEQFHSEIKSDMDLERLPSEHFSTNSDIMTLALTAYNLLRLCGQRVSGKTTAIWRSGRLIGRRRSEGVCAR
jgi:hypothetical protein